MADKKGAYTMNDFTVNIESFSFSAKHPFTIHFQGYFTSSGNKLVSFDYIGSDIINETGYLSDDIKGQLKEALDKDYDNATDFSGKFTRYKIQKVFDNTSHRYGFKYTR